MSEQQSARFYKVDYEKTHEATAFYQRQRSLNTHLYLRPFLRNVGSILDYGCGPGGKLAPLLRDGVEVDGFDMNSRFLDFAETKGLKRWTREKRYDCIFLSHTLEHWINPREDLAKLLARNLKPEGQVIIEVPLIDRLILGMRRGGFHE